MFKRILIVDDDKNTRESIKEILAIHDYIADVESDGISALKRLEKEDYDMVFCDVVMPNMDGITFLQEVISKGFETIIVMMSGFNSIDNAVKAMSIGAYDYITKPFKSDEIILTIRKANERQRLKSENKQLRSNLAETYSFSNIIGSSESLKRIFTIIKKISEFKTTVLISGESGTGKELIAKAIHFNSNRSKMPLVTVNCGTIPENLLESELFGHMQGAFTDAIKNKTGLFFEADKGTLFLDEIGELPLSLQVKLLRVLQEEEIKPVGSNKSIKVDVRIMAATVRNLAKDVEEGKFREDLYYRINVLPINIPPLRERKEDIPLLTRHFINKYNKKLKINIEGITPAAMSLLYDYHWPGNVRELENILERSMVLSDTKQIETKNFPAELKAVMERPPMEIADNIVSIKKANKIMEKILIERTLVITKSNRTQAAKILEISHPSLLYKMKEYSIDL